LERRKKGKAKSLKGAGAGAGTLVLKRGAFRGRAHSLL
jgi:hypothetical protein